MSYPTWGKEILPPRSTGLRDSSTPRHFHRDLWSVLYDNGPLTFQDLFVKVRPPQTATWREYLRWREIRNRALPTAAQQSEADHEYVMRALDLSLLWGWIRFDGEYYQATVCPPDHSFRAGAQYREEDKPLFDHLADDLGWTLFDIAEYTGYDKQTLDRWRSNARRVPGKTGKTKRAVLDNRSSTVRRANTNTEEVNAEVLRLHAEGVPVAEIPRRIAASRRFPNVVLTDKQVYHKLRAAKADPTVLLSYVLQVLEDNGNQPIKVADLVKTPQGRPLRAAHVEQWIAEGILEDCAWYRIGYFRRRESR